MKVNFSKIVIKDIEGRDVQADFRSSWATSSTCRAATSRSASWESASTSPRVRWNFPKRNAQ